MRLREESRIKEKMEFQIDTKHVFYLIVWSIVFSGVIFYTGLVVGERTQPGLQAAPQPLPQSNKMPEELVKKDNEIAPFPPMADLKTHPEKEEMSDVVLNALARLRLETLDKLNEEEERFKEELAEEIFSPRHERRMARLANVEEMMGRTAGIGLQNPNPAVPRLGKAPDMPVPEPEELVREPEVQVPVPEPEKKRNAVAGPKEQQPSKAEEKERADARKRYSIQAKSFRDRNEALIFLGYLQKQVGKSKVQPYIMPVDLANKGKWYRVRLGRFSTRLDAQKFKDQFEKREGIQTILVKL